MLASTCISGQDASLSAPRQKLLSELWHMPQTSVGPCYFSLCESNISFFKTRRLYSEYSHFSYSCRSCSHLHGRYKFFRRHLLRGMSKCAQKSLCPTKTFAFLSSSYNMQKTLLLQNLVAFLPIAEQQPSVGEITCVCHSDVPHSNTSGKGAGI